MTYRYYTNVALENAEEGILNLHDWQSGIFMPPMQYLKSHHLPTMPGARTLAPPGRFATATDITGEDIKSDAPVALLSPMTGAVALLAAFYLFLPQRV